MTDHPGFLAAIIAEPDDDIHRFIYADWLDEHDQPERAELIRVQCALANTIPPMGCVKDEFYEKGGKIGCGCEWCVLRRREVPLLRKDLHLLAGPTLTTIATPVSFEATDFRRGFVERIEATWQRWFELATMLLLVTPLQNVLLYAVPDATNRTLKKKLSSHWPKITFKLER